MWCLLLLLVHCAYATQCDLDITDYANMCDECSQKKSCAKKFNIVPLLTGGCGSEDKNWFNLSIQTLKKVCDPTITTSFAGSVDCEVLSYIAEGLLNECGPICGANEYVKVNTNENALYCACDGKCIDDYKDNTLNSILITLSVLFGIQMFTNLIIMIDSSYKFGLFGQSISINTVAPMLGKNA